MPQLRSLGWEAVHLHPDRLMYSIGSLAKTTAMYYSGQHLEVETKYQARLDPLLLSRSPSEVLLGRAKSDISWKEAGNRPHILWQHSTIATSFLSIVASPVSRHHRPLAAGVVTGRYRPRPTSSAIQLISAQPTRLEMALGSGL